MGILVESTDVAPCRLCDVKVVWLPFGSHDCKRGKGKEPGLSVHRLHWGTEEHFFCRHCGTLWSESKW
jgi:hypothetical protein